MESRGTQGMWGRYLLFAVLAIGVVTLHAYLNPPKRQPPPGGRPEVAEREGDVDAAGADAAEEIEQPGAEAAALEVDETPSKQDDQEAQSRPKVPTEEPRRKAQPWVPPKPALVTLGSLDPESPYRMLVILTNRGAAVAWIELNSDRYRDLEDRSGYLGHLVLDEDVGGRGCPVEVVGPGTPAARAGLQKGDLITAVGGRSIVDFQSLQAELKKTKPGQSVNVTVARKGRELTVPVTLGHRPLEVVRPEADDPLSFLLTLRQIDAKKLDDLVGSDEEEEERPKNAAKKRDPRIGWELDGLDLRTGTWEIADDADADPAEPRTEVTFFRELPESGLKISKTYRLAQVPAKEENGPNGRAYHLIFDVKIENTGERPRQVAYQLDGPTGLPIEGKWFASKVGRSWGAAGLRDLALSWNGNDPQQISCYKIADDVEMLWKEQAEQPGQNAQLLDYIGVDAQYFSAVLIPRREDPKAVWFAELRPLRVGAVDPKWKKATNTSCRLTSTVHRLQPGGEPLEHTFTVFVGPKKPPLLAEYGLDDVVYYGWFGWATVPMLHTLHFFHDHVVFNYGLAILMLTVLVRSCMFPLSRKQALGAQKMQELQPEIKRIHEKYKNNLEARSRAQQELFRKHNYNPLSGCLVLFIQLPIFVGLYRGLMVDVELRQAPLISEAIRWCSNLAAPDMLFEWRWLMPAFVTDNPSGGPLSLLFLGPYFNILPVLTIVLFVLQQKMFMPPPANEQQATQQRIMKFMMIFMGVIFFKVASGLCIYFIASSLWGLAERKLLPKTPAPGSGGTAKTSKPQQSRLQQAAPVRSEPVQTASPQAKLPRPGSNHDGAAGRKKKKKRKRTRGRR